MIFKKIYYPRMLLESLRSFSINKAQQLSVIYKICIACLWPLQKKWDIFDNPCPSFENILKSRRSLLLIANCKWQIGQVENVLNYLFDPIYNRIKIGQTSNITAKYANNFDDSPGLDPLFLNNFDDSPNSSGMTQDQGDYAGGTLFPTTGGSGPGGAIALGDGFTLTGTLTISEIVYIIGTIIIAKQDVPGQDPTKWVETIAPQYFLNFNDISIVSTIALINIPFTSEMPEYTAIDAVVNMIRLKGTLYKLNSI